VSAPVLAGYSGAPFGNGWTDQGGGCDTRAAVLTRDSTANVTKVDRTCAVATGQWLSPYDGETLTNASDVVIDNMVPLAEAWASGASRWPAQTRIDYANDLGYARALIPVTDNVKKSKGDKDPAGWLPPSDSYRCQYAIDWVAIKWRWQLSIDPSEHSELANLLTTGGCGQATVTVDRTTDAIGNPSTLPTDGVLGSGQSLTSAEGGYSLVLQTDGNLVLYTSAGGALWQTGTYGNPGAYLRSQGDGNLVLYATSGRALWFSGRFSPGQTTLVVQADGNLVQYAANGGAVWSTGTYVPPPPPPIAGDRLHPGQTMHAGQQLTSANGAYIFLVQTDGNAVVYSGSIPIWSTRPAGAGSTLTDQSDGNMVLYNSANSPRFSTGTYNNPDSSLLMQIDGNLVVYDSGGRPLWASKIPAPVVVGPVVPPPTVPPANPGDSKNCGDFATWTEANTWYWMYFPYYGDVAKLDVNHDGIPCETLPGAP
ncbi:MAG: putative S-layer domain protein, partial [Pseudonocardiales bacterium]|nr:putative S-layer domain protein [Pseudonocardiales bacterium]